MSITEVFTINAEAGGVVGGENNMITAEWCKQLSNGDFITESQILSPFNIYSDRKRFGSFLLIPKSEQQGLCNIIIIANRAGVRLFQHGSWPKTLVSNVLMLTHCSENKRLEFITPDAMLDLKGIVCEGLWNKFNYQFIENKWIVKLK